MYTHGTIQLDLFEMRFRTAVIISVVSSALLIGAMFALQSIMFAAGARWADQGFEIPFYQRVLYAIAVFWSRFWWMATPFLLGLVFFVAFAIFLLSGAMRKHP